MSHSSKFSILTGAVLVALSSIAVITPPANAAVIPTGATAYSSLVTPLPNNLGSIGAEAYEFAHLGNEISPVTSTQPVQTARVTFSTWACESQGPPATGSCMTTPGATFPLAVTITFYSVNAQHSLGSSLASITQTVAIPYRPSTTPNCLPGSGWGATCSGGQAVVISLNLAPMHFVLPSQVVYAISYDTMHQGLHPSGVAGPADSVNVALSHDPTNVTVGSDALAGTLWWDTQHPANYCDGGTGGVGIFRLDSPNVPSCWGATSPTASPYYVPAISFENRAVTESHITSSRPPMTTVGDNYYFHVRATGDNPQVFSISEGALPLGLFIDQHSGKMTGSAQRSGRFSYRIAVTGPYASTSSAYIINVARSTSTPVINAGVPTSLPQSTTFLALAGAGIIGAFIGLAWLFAIYRRRN